MDLDLEVQHASMQYAGQRADLTRRDDESHWEVTVGSPRRLMEDLVAFRSPDLETARAEASAVLVARASHRDRLIDYADQWHEELARILGDRAPDRRYVGPFHLSSEAVEV